MLFIHKMKSNDKSVFSNNFNDMGNTFEFKLKILKHQNGT